MVFTITINPNNTLLDQLPMQVVIWITVLCTSAVAVNINAEDTAYVYSQTVRVE